ncbi:MAG: hypothetical protein ABH826_03530 [Patescibacteria group bacterium]|nr:hypothetical protein [Patescibacteria group bacterium]
MKFFSNIFGGREVGGPAPEMQKPAESHKESEKNTIEMPPADDESEAEEIGMGIEMMESDEITEQINELSKIINETQADVSANKEAWQKLVNEYAASLPEGQDLFDLDPRNLEEMIDHADNNQEKETLQKLTRASEGRNLSNLYDKLDKLKDEYDTLEQTRQAAIRDEKKQREAA